MSVPTTHSAHEAARFSAWGAELREYARALEGLSYPGMPRSDDEMRDIARRVRSIGRTLCRYLEAGK